MGKWTEDLGREIVSLMKKLSKEKPEEKETEPKKKLPGIREIGLPRLFLMLCAGMVLLILTFPDMFSQTGSQKRLDEKKTAGEIQATKEEKSNSDMDTYIENAEARLKALLKQVEGVGDVEVMITVKATGESIPLKDVPYEKNSSSSEEGADAKRTEQNERAEEGTVMVEASDGTVQPYVVKETVPEIEGVAVLAQGGGSSEIKKEIMEAVQALFNIKAHKIKVMKMN